MPARAHFEIFPHTAKTEITSEERIATAETQYGWRLRARNGEIVATGEGHPTPYAAREAIGRLRRIMWFPIIPIEDFT